MENVFEKMGEILNPTQPIEDSSFGKLYAKAWEAKDKNATLLQGYNELIDLLNAPSNIDKQTLMQSIGRTLKKASE